MAEDVRAPRGASRRNRQGDVVDAAIEVFYQKGYSATSVQDVASRVGVLKGSLYHYMDSKEDLLFRICESSQEQAVALMEEVAARGLPPRAHLEAYLTELVHWYLANLERVSLYFKEWRYLTGDNAVVVQAHRRSFFDYLHAIVVAGRGSTTGVATDTRLATFFILGAVNDLPDWYRRSGFSAARVASEFAAIAVVVAFGG